MIERTSRSLCSNVEKLGLVNPIAPIGSIRLERNGCYVFLVINSKGAGLMVIDGRAEARQRAQCMVE